MPPLRWRSRPCRRPSGSGWCRTPLTGMPWTARARVIVCGRATTERALVHHPRGQAPPHERHNKPRIAAEGDHTASNARWIWSQAVFLSIRLGGKLPKHLGELNAFALGLAKICHGLIGKLCTAAWRKKCRDIMRGREETVFSPFLSFLPPEKATRVISSSAATPLAPPNLRPSFKCGR
jgi:hypothetical protein